MRGMNSATGRPLDGIDHLRQSVADILLTPLGSRVMLRDYGSNLFELVDKPVNAQFRLELYAATIGALQKWEPRLRVDRVSLDESNITAGVVEIILDATYFPDGVPARLPGIGGDGDAAGVAVRLDGIMFQLNRGLVVTTQ